MHLGESLKRSHRGWFIGAILFGMRNATNLGIPIEGHSLTGKEIIGTRIRPLCYCTRGIAAKWGYEPTWPEPSLRRFSIISGRASGRSVSSCSVVFEVPWQRGREGTTATVFPKGN